MSDKASEKSAVSSVVEASVLVRRAAEPREVGDSVKSAIRRAALRLRFSYIRTRSIWYQEARRIDADEMDRLRERAARTEAEQAVNNLVALRERLAQADPEFYRETIVHLEHAMSGVGVQIRSVAEEEQ